MKPRRGTGSLTLLSAIERRWWVNETQTSPGLLWTLAAVLSVLVLHYLGASLATQVRLYLVRYHNSQPAPSQRLLSRRSIFVHRTRRSVTAPWVRSGCKRVRETR